MKNFFSILFLTLIFCSCSEKGNLTVAGTVKGLKKGTLFLQHIKDSSLVNLDSLVVDGDPAFEFVVTLEEPEVFYLYLDKADASGYDDRIPFFAEKGDMNIVTSLKNFESFAAITGSENQAVWKQYQAMNKQFNDKNLDLIKGSFVARKDAMQENIAAYDDSLQNLIKRKYQYTGNFVVNNKELEIAPYLLMTQIPDANPVYLDTLYNKFPRKIQQSKYGKEVKNLIEKKIAKN